MFSFLIATEATSHSDWIHNGHPNTLEKLKINVSRTLAAGHEFIWRFIRWVLFQIQDAPVTNPPWSSDQGTRPLKEKKGCEIAKSYIVCPLQWTSFFPRWGWSLINLQVKIKMKAIASGLLGHTQTSFSFCHPPGFSLTLTLRFLAAEIIALLTCGKVMD